ncbi:hypothetical protein DPMN_053880 [Dreissena polymorpha]|uniref:Uncharacterized protein n=1 Tax=Dreissena polymorpha TaxID=45954 RepID=A0A9D4CNP3_DREPO|nr:hypothetical protein DPMN_053880 [Dreissena polymorpha]
MNECDVNARQQLRPFWAQRHTNGTLILKQHGKNAVPTRITFPQIGRSDVEGSLANKPTKCLLFADP